MYNRKIFPERKKKKPHQWIDSRNLPLDVIKDHEIHSKIGSYFDSLNDAMYKLNELQLELQLKQSDYSFFEIRRGRN